MANIPIISFNAGELTPQADARSDVEKYSSGCRASQNMIPTIYGSATRRPGSKYIYTAKDSSVKIKMRDFRYSDAIAYEIELGNLYMRFYFDGAILNDDGDPVEVVTPYLEADLYELQFTQSADTMWITHRDYAPRKLTRTSATEFSLDTIAFTKGPFLTRNDLANADDVTMASSVVAAAATGTLTASAATFSSDHVGALFKLTHPKDAGNVAETLTKSSASGNSTGIAIKGTFKFSVQGQWAGTAKIQRNEDSAGWEDYRTFTSGSISIPRTVQWSGKEEADNVIFRIYLDETGGGSATGELTSDESTRDGIVRVDSYTSTTVVNITVLVALDSEAATDTTKRWAEGAWSAVQGYPASFALFEERGIYAGTTNNLLTKWLSESGDYEDFEVGTNDSDSFSLVLPSTDAIRWVAALDKLLVGTAGGEWRTKAPLDESLTPKNYDTKQQSARGSAKIQPIVANEAVLFVDFVGRKIRELVFSEDKQKFLSPDLTALAEHITKGGISSIAYQKNPDPILWATISSPPTRADGSVISLISMTYEREQNVVAWAPHPLGGDGIAESVSVIPGTSEDEVWLSVRRTINGSTVRYIEQLQPRDWGSDDEDVFFVDSGLTYDGVATSTLTGLGHLEGETVSVLGNGAKFTVNTVSGGSITLAETVTKAHVGLAYTYKLEPMTPDITTQTGTARGSILKITEIVANFYKTLNAKYGPNNDELKEIDWRTTEPYDAPPNLFTGEKVLTFDGGFSREGRVVIIGSDPFPCTVRSIILRVEKTSR